MTAILLPIACTCWLCARIVTPPKPLPDNAVEQRVYARLLGRHQRLVSLAVGLSGVALLALILALPSHATTDSLRRPAVSQICTDRPGTPPTCYIWQPGGDWLVEQWEGEGAAIRTWIVSRPPSAEDLARGSGG